MSTINPQNKMFRDNLKANMPAILTGVRGQFGYGPDDIISFKFIHLYSQRRATGLVISINGQPEIAMSYDRAMDYSGLKEFTVNYGGNQCGKLWGKMVEIPGFPYVKAFITWSTPMPDGKDYHFFVYEFSTGMKLYYAGSNSSQEAIRLAAKNIASMIKVEGEYESFVNNVIKMYGRKNS